MESHIADGIAMGFTQGVLALSSFAVREERRSAKADGSYYGAYRVLNEGME